MEAFYSNFARLSARYQIQQGGRSEAHSSSGIIVSTGLGSTGWFQSLLAGAAGVAGHALAEPTQAMREHGFAWDADHLQFTMREPSPSRTTQVELVHGQVTDKEPLQLVSQMAGYGVIFSDGIEADFLESNAGMTATISMAERYGQRVNCDSKRISQRSC